MTSVLNVDTIADKAGSGPVALTKQSAAKAWRKYDTNGGTTNTESFNYSSITDNNTGDTTHTLTNAMNTTTYVVMHNTQAATFSGVENGTPNTATAHRTQVYNSSVALVDVDQNFVHVSGDLA